MGNVYTSTYRYSGCTEAHAPAVPNHTPLRIRQPEARAGPRAHGGGDAFRVGGWDDVTGRRAPARRREDVVLWDERDRARFLSSHLSPSPIPLIPSFPGRQFGAGGQRAMARLGIGLGGDRGGRGDSAPTATPTRTTGDAAPQLAIGLHRHHSAPPPAPPHPSHRRIRVTAASESPPHPSHRRIRVTAASESPPHPHRGSAASARDNAGAIRK